LIIMPRYGLS